MRYKFDNQLEELNRDLMHMGALCENAISMAVKAFIESDTSYGETAMEVDKEIDQKEKDIEQQCLRLLLQQQPVAKDLRIISAALKMITDI
ncbi:MAG: PhoU domain-containing protein, partial [Oscillospiraceae bacterium]